MNALDVLELLEQATGSNDKKSVLKSNKNNPELFELLDAALNFDRKFYIKKFNTTFAGVQKKSDLHENFMSILESLENRAVTGHAAINLVNNFLQECTSLQFKWYSRIIRKDLRCNFGVSLAKDAGFDIPEFEVMLAKDAKKMDADKLRDIVTKGVYLSPKFDGYRCLAVCEDGEVTLHSRNGVIYDNFPSIENTLAELTKGQSLILDGEIMSNDFNAMQQTAFSSVSNKTVGDVKYYVFGWVSYDEWLSKKFETPTGLRLNNLKEFFNQNKDAITKAGNLVQVEQKLVYKVESILEFEQDCLARGYEGAMALPNIPYFLGKKSNKLMKFKTMLSQDCKVVDLYEGEGRLAGTMGGLKLIQENGEKCDVGSGFTDEDRAFMWKNPKEVIGRTAEIKYQELTPDNIMRFPVFIRWRNDK